MARNLEHPDLFATTDRSIAILLIWKGVKITKRTKNGYKTTFHFDRECARPFVEAWQNGERIPVADIREIFSAENTFNSAVHDEI
jgi:hypothetical protein